MNDFITSLLYIQAQNTPYDKELWELVWRAHRLSAEDNDSVSKTVAAIAGDASGSFIHAATAAMMTVGTKHGPIGRARLALNLTEEEAEAHTRAGVKIPGFGNSFFKSGIDPAWEPVNVHLMTFYPSAYETLARVQRGIQRAGKQVFPNPGGLSALACNATGIPSGVEEGIFVLPRIHVWWTTFLKTKETI